MAKGSVRKKGKKWYYRFYVEDESGNRVQKEFPGTESKGETESLLRKAMEDYENTQRIAASNNLTVADLLDRWSDEVLEPGKLSNGTVESYKTAIRQIKTHPISRRRLKTVTTDHLQKYMDYLSLGGKGPDGQEREPMCRGTLLKYSAVLRGAFKYAVIPKHFLTSNPMLLVSVHFQQDDEAELFGDDSEDVTGVPILSEALFARLEEYLMAKQSPALLPIQIAYYTGLRIGEVCGLCWKDIDMENQQMTVRRSVRYNADRNRQEIGPTKRKKIRVVDFGDTLADILKKAKAEQHRLRFKYGELYRLNYYEKLVVKGRTHYELHFLPRVETPQEGWKEIDFVCVKPDGSLEVPKTVGSTCKSVKDHVPGFEGFHFHMLRHTYTSRLLEAGARPKVVQDLLGHSSITTTMKVYAHSTDEAKRASARLLDKPAVMT